MFVVITVVHVPSVEYFSQRFSESDGNTSLATTASVESELYNRKSQFEQRTASAFGKLASFNFTKLTVADLQHISSVGKKNIMHGSATCFNMEATAVLPEPTATSDIGSRDHAMELRMG